MLFVFSWAFEDLGFHTLAVPEGPACMFSYSSHFLCGQSPLSVLLNIINSISSKAEHAYD